MKTTPELKNFIQELWARYWGNEEFPEWVDSAKYKKQWKKDLKKNIKLLVKNGEKTVNMSKYVCVLVSGQVDNICNDEDLFVKIPKSIRKNSSHENDDAFYVSYPKDFDFMEENEDVKFVNKKYKKELKSLADGTLILPKDEGYRNDGKAVVYKGKAIPLFNGDEDMEVDIDYGGPVPQFPYPEYPFDKWNRITYITFRWLSDRKYMKDFKKWVKAQRNDPDDPVEEFSCTKVNGKWLAMAL